MDYQKDYRKFSESYHSGRDAVFSDDEVEIVNTTFRSRFFDVFTVDNASQAVLKDVVIKDSAVEENRFFTYPVIRRKDHPQKSEAIILLHGLNERSWKKYLPWGKALCIKTGHPVILFPTSFHMNRSPEKWINPRCMMPWVAKRRQQHPGLRESSVANAAISSRLEEYPQRFLLSGLETYFDLVDLTDMLYQGRHPLLKNISAVHFFGYSIGALLTQIMLMTDVEKRFSRSKAFLFCGGTTLDRMEGASRFILDSAAFEAIRKCYISDGFSLKPGGLIREKLKSADVEAAFSAMMSSAAGAAFRSSALLSLQNRLRVYALEKDDVIPAEAVRETFSGIFGEENGVVTSLDFPFKYTHVTPFPCNDETSVVNQAFEKVFSDASDFLK